MAADRWGAGEKYESFMGRWSRVLAARFVRLVPVPAGSDWVDVGCGTGALSGAVLALASPRSVLGVDPAPGFVDHVRHVIDDPRFRAEVAEATALGLADNSVDAVVSSLVLNFVPDAVAALVEGRRVVRPGGVVGGFVWDYAEGMGMLRVFWEAAVELDDDARSAAEGVRFTLCHPEPLRQALLEAGLSEVHVEAIDATARFDGFDDYWSPFLGGQGPAAGYVARLGQDRQAALRERLREQLPTAPDGSIQLGLRAWAFWGTS
jgi:SAM-dependent methyltransferase